MNFVLFIGWVLFIFICSDLVGSALRFRLSLLSSRQMFAADQGRGLGARTTPVDFVHSTLLGFATLWVSLSAAYALGIATQHLIVAFIGFAAVAAAISQRRHLVSWARGRLMFWGLIGAVALLAAFVRPGISGDDDPEYFFLINKLLRTGSIVEYFNYRRPITLGGWTFTQAIFSAGPAGVAFVASIDAIVGAILFLLCAFLIGISTPAAIPAALSLPLVLSVFQINLGTAITMAAICAVLVGLSLPASAPRNSFTPAAFAVMAVTIRPQLGLVAIVAIAFVLWRNRSKSLSVGAIIVGVSALWVAIFLRDTGLFPLSTSPGYNPQLVASLNQPPLSRQMADLWNLGLVDFPRQWMDCRLMVVAVAICSWQSLAKTHGVAAVRNEFQVLGSFSIAVVATYVIMVGLTGSLASVLYRYAEPIVEAFLFVFLVRVALQTFHIVPSRVSKDLILAAVTTAVLGSLIVNKSEKLSMPTQSSEEICSRLLTQDEERAFERLRSDSGYVLLAINCPVGSFAMSSVMMDDLFFATRGDYFDFNWGVERTASWLQSHAVDRLVYLEKDAGPNFDISFWQLYLEYLGPDPSDYAIERKRQTLYWIKSIAIVHELAEYCESTLVPIRDSQGPLVVVNVRQCGARYSRSGPQSTHTD